ncbi:MAG: hypothetical protein AAGE18_13745 [Pseudomonadota bacterium]
MTLVAWLLLLGGLLWLAGLAVGLTAMVARNSFRPALVLSALALLFLGWAELTVPGGVSADAVAEAMMVALAYVL